MKKTLSVLMALVLALSMCAMTMVTAFAASSDAALTMESSAAKANVGDQIVISIDLKNDSTWEGVGSLGFAVLYDASEFEFVSETISTSIITLPVVGRATPGQILYNGTSVPANQNSGTLYTATFKVLKQPNSGFTLKVNEVYVDEIGNIDGQNVTESVAANSTKSITIGCPHSATSSTVTKEPTCTEAGTKTITCSVCGETLGTESIPATGHNFGAWAVVKEATCTEEGIEERVCADCGEKETRTIAKTAHTPGEWEVTKEPTCTEDGEKVQKCTVCGEVIATEVVPALGHTVADDAWTVTKEPTCTEDGEKEGVCEVCGETVVEVIPALGHTVADDAWTVTKEPTCTEDGEKEGVCEVCGETAVETIPALGHDFGEWVVVKEATETEEGLKERVCAVCGEKETEVIPKLSAEGEGVTGDTNAPSIPKTSGAVIGGVASLAMLSMAAGVAVATVKKKRKEDK